MALGKGLHDGLSLLPITLERGHTLHITPLALERTLSVQFDRTNVLLLLPFGVHD